MAVRRYLSLLICIFHWPGLCFEINPFCYHLEFCLNTKIVLNLKNVDSHLCGRPIIKVLKHFLYYFLNVALLQEIQSDTADRGYWVHGQLGKYWFNIALKLFKRVTWTHVKDHCVQFHRDSMAFLFNTAPCETSASFAFLTTEGIDLCWVQLHLTVKLRLLPLI